MIKFNKKGEMTWPIIFGAIIGIVIVLILMYIASDYIFGGASNIAEFGACEKGGEVVGMPGICIKSTIACKDIDGAKNPGSFIGGCPSAKTKQVYGTKEAKEYTKCCVLEKCSDAELVDLKGEDYTAKNIEKCLGYSQTCTEKGQCCCVKEIPKK